MVGIEVSHDAVEIDQDSCQFGLVRRRISGRHVASIPHKPNQATDHQARLMLAPMHRPEAPSIALAPDERTALTEFLDFYRAALIDRCFGLTAEQLRETPLPTTLSLTRIVGHMAWVEQFWFVERFAGDDPQTYVAQLDWDADNNAEMTLAESWDREHLFSIFDDAVAESRRRTEGARLDDLSATADHAGEHWNMRWILVHMIEEYARHCGHADLIREAIDGDVL